MFFWTVILSLTLSPPVHAADNIAGLTYNEAEGYYEIKDVDSFKAFITYANSVSGETSTQCANMTFKLTADIGSESSPVGSIQPITRFKGNFDGGDHTIFGITINGSDNMLGLFCRCFDNEIKDLTLKDIAVSRDVYVDNSSTGAIVGWGNTKLENCHVTGSVRSQGGVVGGLVGQFGSGSWGSPSYIKNCSFSGSVTGEMDSVGGILGYANYNSTLTIGDCVVTNAEITGRKAVGGIWGGLYESVPTTTGCKVANTTITATNNENKGAIVGNYGLYAPTTSSCTYHCKDESVKGIGFCKIDNTETWNSDSGCTRVYALFCSEDVEAVHSSGEITTIGDIPCYSGTAGENKFTLNAEREGYSKEYTVSGAGASLEGSTLTIAANTANDVTVSVSFSVIVYTLNYELADGTLASANPKSYTVESPDFKLNRPAKKNYKFTGWTGGGLSAASRDVTITQGSIGDRTYTATWGEYPNTYYVSTPAGLSITQSGWNSTAGVITASADAEDFDPAKKIIVSVISPNDWKLKDTSPFWGWLNSDTVSYTLKAKQDDTTPTTTWTFTSADLFKDGGTTITFGAEVEDFSAKRPGAYEDSVKFSVNVSE